MYVLFLISPLSLPHAHLFPKEKRPDMTKLQVFQALINVHFRQLVVLGHARGDKIIFAEVRWVDATAPL